MLNTHRLFFLQPLRINSYECRSSQLVSVLFINIFAGRFKVAGVYVIKAYLYAVSVTARLWYENVQHYVEGTKEIYEGCGG